VRSIFRHNLKGRAFFHQDYVKKPLLRMTRQQTLALVKNASAAVKFKRSTDPNKNWKAK